MRSRARSTSPFGVGAVYRNCFDLMTSKSNIDTKFESMRDSGRGAKEAASVAIADGLNFVETIQMLHRVFNQDFVHAKEAWIQASGTASSLDEYQGRLVPAIDEALAEMKKRSK
jgi:hypothetical protein